MFPRRLRIAILCVAICAACFSKGVMASLRSALNAAPILTSRLVQTGKISERQKFLVDTDFKDGFNVGLTLGDELGDAVTAQQKYQAAKKAYQGWLAIYNRGNFRHNQDIKDAADIASGIFELIEAYWGDKAGAIGHSDIAADGMSEDDFKQDLKDRIDKLERAMKKQ